MTHILYLALDPIVLSQILALADKTPDVTQDLFFSAKVCERLCKIQRR